MNHSKQREVVKSIVCSMRWHPTASEVYTKAKTKMPNISLGTVYRDLNQLSDAKEILKITDSSGETRFDGQIYDHVHFLCTRCGALTDIENENTTKLIKNAYKCSGNVVDSACLLLKGICSDCKN